MAAKPQKAGKGWRVRWIDSEGKRRSKTYSDYAQARAAQANKRGYPDDFISSTSENPRKTSKEITLCDAWNHWQESGAKSKKSAKTDESFWRIHLEPFFGDILLKDITLILVEQFKQDEIRAHCSENTISHHLALLATLLRHAHENELVDKVIKVKKYKLDQQEKKWLKTKEEVAAGSRQSKVFEEPRELGDTIRGTHSCTRDDREGTRDTWSVLTHYFLR